MKQSLLFLSLFFIFSFNSYAEKYFVANAGAGGGADAGSFGLEFGSTAGISSKVPLGLEISGAFTADALPDGLLDYQIPHNDYTYMGKYNDGPEIGLLVKTGYSLKEHFYIIFGAGASFQTVDTIVQSNATGWYYKQEEENKVYGQGYAGLMYLHQKLVLTCGYNNRRGGVIGLGVNW